MLRCERLVVYLTDQFSSAASISTSLGCHANVAGFKVLIVLILLGVQWMMFPTVGAGVR